MSDSTAESPEPVGTVYVVPNWARGVAWAVLGLVGAYVIPWAQSVENRLDARVETVQRAQRNEGRLERIDAEMVERAIRLDRLEQWRARTDVLP